MASKYTPGRRIATIAEFSESGCTMFFVRYGRTMKATHIGFLAEWQYRLLRDRIKAGDIWEAMIAEEGGTDAKETDVPD